MDDNLDDDLRESLDNNLRDNLDDGLECDLDVSTLNAMDALNEAEAEDSTISPELLGGVSDNGSEANNGLSNSNNDLSRADRVIGSCVVTEEMETATREERIDSLVEDEFGVVPNHLSAMEEFPELGEQVLGVEMLEKFPSLTGVSSRDLIIVMSVAHGFGYRAIAASMNISASTVSNVMRRIDPRGIYRLDRNSKKAFLANRSRALTAEILGVVDIEAIREAKPVSQIKMAKTMSEITAIQDRRDDNLLGGQKIKKVTVEFVDEIDEAEAVTVIRESESY